MEDVSWMGSLNWSITKCWRHLAKLQNPTPVGVRAGCGWRPAHRVNHNRLIVSRTSVTVIHYHSVYTVSGKKRPPKHVQITLWLENDSHYFSLYHEKPSICNVCVKFHGNQSVHCWDIPFYKKMVGNCRRQHCQLLTRARNAYLRPPISTPAHCASAFT